LLLRSSISSESPLDLFLLFSLFGMPIAYAAEVVLGIAAWTAFRRAKIQSPFVFAIVGGTMGWLVPIALEGHLATSRAIIALYVIPGASSALLFRAIVGRYAEENPH
jgi:hypothetical protein